MTLTCGPQGPQVSFPLQTEYFVKNAFLLGTLATFGLTAPALAENSNALSYTYVEAGYVSTELDDDVFGTDIDGDGFSLQGAVAFTPHIHAYAEYINQDFDFDVSIDTWEIGVGANWPLAKNLDVIGRLGFANADADVVDEDGFALQAGLRGRLGERFELEGLAHYVDLGDLDDNTSFRLTGRAFVTNAFAITAGAEFDSDAAIWTIGGRYTFPAK